MKIIYNKMIPFGSFGAVNILGILFSKISVEKITNRLKRHEGTHTYQQYELLMTASIISLILCNIYTSWLYLWIIPIIPFVVYVASFLIEMFIPPYHNAKEYFSNKSLAWKIKSIGPWFYKVWIDAYRDNCFEREAYAHENDSMYLATRPIFGWAKYIIHRDERRK